MNDLTLRAIDYVALCDTCELFHRSPAGTREGIEFLHRHQGHQTQIAQCGEPMCLQDASGRLYRGNASVKEAFGTATAFTKTNANLSSSATVGWVSNAIDNSSNLYLDALVHFEFAAVNTAPASSKAIYCYAFGLVDAGASAYTSTGDGTPSGSEGTLTYPDVTTLAVVCPTLGVIPYPVQNKAINGGPFSVAAAFSGILPPKWAVGMVNHSGMTLSVTNVKYIETYNTVA